MEETEQTKPETGPGYLLTAARLKLGLETQNVAEMLHLRSHQILALEADDYENLPEPTYVKGYLRAYCQLLSLDPEEIVKNYIDFVAPPVSEAIEGPVQEKISVRNDDMVKLISGVMVVLVLSLVVIFWLSGKDESPVEQITTVETSPGIEMPAGSSVALNNQKEQAKLIDPSSKPLIVADNEPMLKKAVEPSALAKVEQKEALTVEKSQPQTDSNQTDNSSVGIRNEVSLLPETDELTRTRLLIKVISDSWVDVRDARDNKLIYETIPAGREIPLEGLAPFKVFLGNASGVKVFLEGKEYDVALHKRGLTARFTLRIPAETR